MRRLAITLIAFLIMFGGVGVAYWRNAQKLKVNEADNSVSVEQDRAINAPAANQKSGTTTKVGMLSKSGNRFFLKEGGSKAIEVDSYEIDLNTYIGQTVTVTGQYSGDTLFVSELGL
jgi:hypothetical protein